ncbi:MAG: peptide deformylase [Thermodesulfobacteriota bacterium]|nr:peptide deformylase [Thermodesulfobacteriota bacterium]
MDICVYPDPVLKEVAEPVENIDSEIQGIVDSMANLMYNNSGIGLAANQVGIPKRIIIFDISYKEKAKDLTVLINPAIVSGEDKIIYEEGCLSVPDFQGKINRKKYIKVQGLNRDGNLIDIDAEDLTAICIQHEIDHLNGVLILDHVSILKRNIYRKKIEKLVKENKNG